MKVLKNTSVVDVINRQLLNGVDVVISGTRITAVQAAAAYDDDAEIIDAAGKYVIPGMIDMHGHFFTAMLGKFISIPDTAAPLYLSNGITTVCSKGDLEEDKIIALRDCVESGVKIGSRVLTAGRILNGPPNFSDAFETCSSAEEIAAAYKNKRDRIDFVKIYEFTTKELAKAVIDEAHKDGLKVYGHLGVCSVTDAVTAGIDGYEHGVFCTSEMWEPLKNGERKPSVLRLESFDPDSYETEKLIDAIVEHDVAVTPTVSTIQLLYGQNLEWFEERNLWDLYEAGLGDKLRQEYVKTVTSELLIKMSASADAAIEKQNRMLERFYKKGGRIYVGTDPSVPYVIGGMNIVKEAMNMQAFGLNTMDVLRALTIEAACELKIQATTGSVDAGKDADLVILDSNPLVDLNNLKNISAVFKAGRSYNPKDLKDSVKNTIPLATDYGMNISK